MTTTASLVFKAAHAAAKVADALVAYRARFTTALRAAWAAAKQTAKTVMSTILTTLTVEDPHATAGTVPARVYDVYVATATTVFAVLRPIREGRPARQIVASVHKSLAGGGMAFQLNGATYYTCADLSTWADVDARDARRDILVADAQAAQAALAA